MSQTWPPPLVLLTSYAGDWTAYGAALYAIFKHDFLDSQPAWPGKAVHLKRLPLVRGKEATYWHFLTKGDDEQARNLDVNRCERIRWPRPFMEAFTNRRPLPTDPVVWWKNERQREISYLIALPDFTYVMVVRDRGTYVVPWTQYFVDKEHTRRKYQKEYEDYWKTRKS